MFWCATLNWILLLVLACIITQANSVYIACESKNRLTHSCRVPGMYGATDLTRTHIENARFKCQKGINYGTTMDANGGVSIWVLLGCGGTFRVTKTSPTSPWEKWGPWSACSTSCGSGIQYRIRTCSTGYKTDCSANINDNSQVQVCNGKGCEGNRINEVPATSSICGLAPGKFQDRIIGGLLAKKCEYPWAVKFESTKTGYFCGGSIIDSTHILTAGHCVVTMDKTSPKKIYTTPEELNVYTGSSTVPTKEVSATSIPGLKIRKVSKVTVHEDYDRFSSNDIAILTLTEPIKFDDCHVPVCMGTTNLSPNTSGCKVIGWGNTQNGKNAKDSSQLRVANLEIVEPWRCYNVITRVDQTKQICTNGNKHSSCEGDSGGPLICKSNDGRYYQHGIVSGGEDGNCGNSESYYTRVTGFKTWISSHTK